MSASASQTGPTRNELWLFWACFIALIATAFGFIVRSMIIGELASEFGLDETQKGQILGVGLWPFALSIVLFSLVIDKIGYGNAMIFAFICHVTSAIITIFATGYWGLYIGNFIVALGNGTVEAVINPVVATMFSREKTKWLNILHAGWPGGLVLGGLLTLAMGPEVDWRLKVGLIFIPVIGYGLMMLSCKFPVNERVAAGVPYKTMLQEVGIVGCLIVTSMIVFEVARVFKETSGWFKDWDETNFFITKMLISLGITAVYGAYVRSLGRPMFIFLLLIMIPLSVTELGTDSWITELLTPEMTRMGLQAGWLLVYTSLIMMILRFFAGPIVHSISPLGLLAVSSLVAAAGLVALSQATGIMILAAATLYGFGKTFFWPTMLGVVAERFPKGGALTLNATGGMGMLAVGVFGTALLGSIQDREIDRSLQATDPALFAQVVGEQRVGVLGAYRPLEQAKLNELNEEQLGVVAQVREEAKKSALKGVAVFPIIMLVCYLGLILYFRTQGGYKSEVLAGHGAEDGEFTGGVSGPMA